jgi:hypothetical protein
MSRDRAQDSSEKLSPAECIEAAQTFVNFLFDPENTWYRNAVLMGLDIYSRHPGAYEASRSKLLELHPFLGNAQALSLEDRTRVRIALQRKQPEKLLELVRRAFTRNPPTRESLNLLFATIKPLPMRKALLAAADQFKGRQGRPSDVTAVGKELAAFAEKKLAPAILNVLQSQERGTRYSLQELLDIATRDYPEASSFLLRHVALFEKAINDEKLLRRGKQLQTRAQVLADAMAGADYGLKFSTSMKRVSEARKRPFLNQ